MLYLMQAFKILKKLLEACAVANARTNTISVTQTDPAASLLIGRDNFMFIMSYNMLSYSIFSILPTYNRKFFEIRLSFSSSISQSQAMTQNQLLLRSIVEMCTIN